MVLTAALWHVGCCAHLCAGKLVGSRFGSDRILVHTLDIYELRCIVADDDVKYLRIPIRTRSKEISRAPFEVNEDIVVDSINI